MFALRYEFPECILVILARGEDLVMVPANSANQAQIWLESQEVTIKFVTFVHEIFGALNILTHLPKADFGTDRITDGHAKLLEQPNDHGGRSAFTVRAGYGHQFEFFILYDQIE